MKRLMITGFALALVALPTAADAQLGFGPQASFATETELSVGGRLLVGLSQFRPGLHAIVTADYILDPCGGAADAGEGYDVSCIAMEFTGNAALPVPLSKSLYTYAGAGLSYFRSEFESTYDDGFGFSDSESMSASETGLNVFGGIRRGALFAEARYVTTGSGQIVLTGGILLGGAGKNSPPVTAAVSAPTSAPSASGAPAGTAASTVSAPAGKSPAPTAPANGGSTAATKPYSLDDVAAMLTNGISTSRVLDLAARSCISFRMNDAAETRLRRSGAEPELIEGMRKACFSAR